jgi:cytochrome c oxidase assembly protein subunit 11
MSQPNPTNNTVPIKRRNNRKLLWGLVIGTCLMFGFGYLLVPIYNVMCKAFGINGKTNTAPIENLAKNIDLTRTLTVQFLTTNNESIPWSFHPNTWHLDTHPGQNTRVTFFAQNNSDHTMTIQAIPSILPRVAAKYFLKTECFCFAQQTLKPHEKMNMPVVFHIDKGLPADVKTITLSYTIFDVHASHTKS